MKKFIIDFYEETWDEQAHGPISVKRKFIKAYQTNERFSDIEERFYPLLGEGLGVSSNSSKNLAYFKINIFWDRELDKFLEFLSKFEEVEEIPDFVSEFSNFEFDEFVQLDIGDEELTAEQLAEIEKIIEEENKNAKILRGQEIYEKGASSYWITYLIACSAGLTINILSRIFDYLKERNIEFPEPDLSKINVSQIVKNHLLNEYNLKPSDLFLSRFYDDRDDGVVEFKYRTKKKEFRVDATKDGEIIKIKVVKNKRG
tara:strand:+ start:130 stop:903 length:774 start_codon:yes stop_codon:yes gene_type:complete